MQLFRLLNWSFALLPRCECSPTESAASLCARFRAARIQLGPSHNGSGQKRHTMIVLLGVFFICASCISRRKIDPKLWNSKPFILIGRATHSIHLFVSAGFYAQISQDSIK
jgi:hypothetical protein